jgi:hypothetical protein
MIFSKNKESQSVPHPELVPLTEEECEYPICKRNPMLSRRDYSLREIEAAKAKGGPLPSDMREYCHNNGISWEEKVAHL